MPGYGFQCSSASRKFLNRRTRCRNRCHSCVFQCSSASRKFLNLSVRRGRMGRATSFSALQRAENSSMPARSRHRRDTLRFSALQRAENSSIHQQVQSLRDHRRFQCSSASRKFLNRNWKKRKRSRDSPFQCSSASRKFLNFVPEQRRAVDLSVSVLFSEPKIPQCGALLSE